MRLFGFIVLLVLLSLVMAQTVSAQNSPVVPVPMVPFAQWPPAVPTTGSGISVGNQAGISNATTPPEPEVNTSLSPAQVVGTGNFVGLSSAYSLTSDQPSLAEAAREARQKLAKEHPRVFTNDDIARLRQKAGEPAIGIAAAGPPVTSQQTMPASDVTTTNLAAPNAVNPNAPDGTQGNGVQSNVPASDQTAPQGSSTQPPPVKSSPFRPKQ